MFLTLADIFKNNFLSAIFYFLHCKWFRFSPDLGIQNDSF